MVLTREIVLENVWNNVDRITADMLSGYTEIGDFAFMDCDHLVYIELPNTITRIGEGAFKRCVKLYANKTRTSPRQPVINYFTIPSSVTSIGVGAFKNCSSLQKVIMSSTGITAIPDELFSGCVALQHINTSSNDTLPTTITSIGKEAFEFCEALTKIVLPSSLVSIGDEAFAGCIRLSNISLPTSARTIGLRCFADCLALTSLPITNLTTVGDEAFDGSGISNPLHNSAIFAFCPRDYEGEYDIPNGITTIAGGAFKECRELTKIVLPTSLTTIGTNAFYSCSYNS